MLIDLLGNDRPDLLDLRRWIGQPERIHLSPIYVKYRNWFCLSTIGFDVCTLYCTVYYTVYRPMDFGALKCMCEWREKKQNRTIWKVLTYSKEFVLLSLSNCEFRFSFPQRKKDCSFFFHAKIKAKFFHLLHQHYHNAPNYCVRCSLLLIPHTTSMSHTLKRTAYLSIAHQFLQKVLLLF